MSQSSRMGLPYLMPNQAQKHVTLNEALRRLDLVVQVSAQSQSLTAPPAEPEEGAMWIVADEPTGGWAGQADKLAAYQDGAWVFLAPGAGWLAYILDEGALRVWSGEAWIDAVAPPEELQELARLGIDASADADNPFSARLNKALWNAKPEGEGGTGDLRYTLNKESDNHVLSLLMQSGWSGRAEIGLVGSDDLSFRVSADGSTWKDALIADRASGAVSFPQGVVHAETGLTTQAFLPSAPCDIWRPGGSRAATPRSFTIAAVSGDEISLTSPRAGEIFGDNMRGLTKVRIWNMTRTPAESAWVDWNVSTDTLRVSDVAHIAAWSTGDALRLGDPNPEGDNTLEMIALDISGYLQSAFGAVFRQKSLLLNVAAASSDGPAQIGMSGSGAVGSVVTANALSDGGTNNSVVVVSTPIASPVSDSNLLFLRERMSGGSTDLTQFAFVRALGVYV